MGIDFLLISTRSTKRGSIEIYPKFIIKKSSDLMIRGGDFYAIWIEENRLWSTDEQDVIKLVDSELDNYAKTYRESFDGDVRVLHMWDSESGMIDSWHRYCQKQMRDSFHMLDEHLIFSNHNTTKTDYASKKLNYPLEKGDIKAYNELVSTLYSEEERRKIEWAIGSIVCGESKNIQKFMVLYGAAGTGKSTILNIIQQLFDGYYSVFDAKALGSSSNTFALEAFKSNPLVAIQHDGDLSRIEDNTRLNSLVSHEMMTVNEKFKSTYANRFKCFLFMGTNKPVKITDAKSGLIRRLIDVSPSGNKLSQERYDEVKAQINFELGGIAYHCKQVYLENPNRYDSYIPISMLGASNDFFNFILDSYYIFHKDNSTTLKSAWEMYKTYCDDAKVSFPLQQRVFREELKNYFSEYTERYILEDGSRVRSYYYGFRTEKLEGEQVMEPKAKQSWLIFDKTTSIFDEIYSDIPAQYASEQGTPQKKWSEVFTKLSSIDTSKLHYVKLPENSQHIVVDFDILDGNGKKSLEKNIEAASKFPPTYSELSRSGAGVHLHYIYSGDISNLSRAFGEHIEVKIFNGNSSLRRKLTLCNGLKIATINSGLPLKGEKVINFEGLRNEKALRTSIIRNLEKEIHPGTKPSIDFIYKILEDAYLSGMAYDVTDMRNAILAFAASSTNQSSYCIGLVNKMHFKSDEISQVKPDDGKIIFFDIEVFPNLFLVNWKLEGDGNPVVRMINPTRDEIEQLLNYRLVGFNCRRYDNHILYGRLIGFNNAEIYALSQKIISGDKSYFFGEAYNISYTDVYDFASAGNKKSLKKLEIEMGIHHQELGLPWDEPVPQEMWAKVAEYCDNDVIATEAAFKYLKGDWTARQILSDISGLTVNDTTNTLSTKIIFGDDRAPQSQFNYRNMAIPVGSDQYEAYRQKFGEDYIFRVFNSEGLPEYRDYIPNETLPEGWSILPFFPGYTFEKGKSLFMSEEIGEGGKVYSEPGIYLDVWDADVTGQHPSSIIAEMLFGAKYTKAFKEIVDGRVNIKHQNWEAVDKLFGGKLKPYVKKVIDGELTVKELADALKTVVNSVYGLTSASFSNAFRDIRNIDNIVAKRGALFMTILKSEVQKQGFTVCHIKTDSIKIPNATQDIRDFVIKFGKEYGYSFETEAEFDRFCIVNKAVYIARYKDGKSAGTWSATGDQFAVPYVFKTLFSHEDVVFDDLCETKSVSSAIYLDKNENLPDVSEYEKELKKLIRAGESPPEDIYTKIANGHNYIFVGKVGRFCPIKPGCGGGLLLRKSDNKYYAVEGTTGYRWLESEMVKELDKENDIDLAYFTRLVEDAVDTISKFGDFKSFVSSDEDIFLTDFDIR